MSPFRSQLLGVLSSVLGISTVTGCGGTADVNEEKRKDEVRGNFDQSLCTPEGGIQYVTNISPQVAVDYVALREIQYPGATDPVIIHEDGACATTAACEALAVGPEEDGIPGPWESSYHVATASGDNVELYMTLEEVKAFLGTIDTPSEAALVARLSSYNLSCERDNLNVRDDGFEIYAERGHTCGGNITGYRLLVAADGSVSEIDSTVVEKGDTGCAIGRMPCGLLERHLEMPSANDGTAEEEIGAYFARISHLEAAAVVAFEDLARELAHHGAPPALVARAQTAALEETRHALLMGALARRYGAKRLVPEVVRRAPRPLLEIARENAVEGLTRETFGALLGHVQAFAARDPQVREVMSLVAEDETGHAEFSLELHRWLMSQLSLAGRAEVELVRSQAQAIFREEAHQDFSPEIRAIAGLPPAEVSRRLYNELFPAA